MNTLLAGMKKETNKAFTANGAVTNASSLNEVLDFFGLGAALRNRSDADVISLFSKAFAENQLLALKTIFYFRNVRGGQGERKTFRTIMKWLGTNHTNIVVKNIHNIPEFGRWDDLFSLEGTPAWDAAVKYIFKQFDSDMKLFASYLNGKAEEAKISLLVKWLPSTNTSSPNTCRLGRLFADKFSLTEREYRKILSKMRAHLDIVEKKMSSSDWININYQAVPSRAALIYKKAFKKHDESGYTKYIEAVAKGEAKINASTLYPYDIVRTIRNNGSQHDPTNEALWNALPNYVPADGEYKNVLCLCDVSGSMAYSANGLPMDVSISLGIYCGERIAGPFKNHFLTFTSQSNLLKIVGNNITEKVHNLHSAEWGGSTNLQSAFDVILTTAIKWGVKEEEMPEVLIIISDMQFDVACNDNRSTNFEVIKAKYAAAGYVMPKLIFWNVNATSNQTPVVLDDKGTCLVSGCSPAILQSVLSGKIVDPVQVMLDVLNQKVYNVVVV